MHDWTSSPLARLASIQKGRKVEVSDHPRVGYAPYLGAGVIAGDPVSDYGSLRGAVLATETDILMLWDGERSGLVGTGARGVVSSTVAKLIPKPDIDTFFLYYQLSRHFDWIQARRTGTGVPHVPRDLSRILVIEYPIDAKEQRCIAEVLATIDEAINQAEALITKTQAIKAGLMHDLFTRGVMPDGQLRPPREEAPKLYKESPLGWIPREWNCEVLNSLLAKTANPMRSGPFGSALLKDELVEAGIPLLGIDNISSENFMAEYHRFVTYHKFVELSHYSVFPRDVIITIMGTVGRSCVVPDDIGDALSSKHLWTMTFDQRKVLPELVCWQLNHAYWVKSWFQRQAQGAVMDAIQSSTLRTLQLPVPSMDEQFLLLDRYVSCQARLSTEQVKLAKLQQIKAGLMHDLLTGRVRVPIEERKKVVA